MVSRFLIRPSLEYQHVFDICAAQVQHCGAPAALRASSSFYARELLKRMMPCVRPGGACEGRRGVGAGLAATGTGSGGGEMGTLGRIKAETQYTRQRVIPQWGDFYKQVLKAT